MSENRGVSIYFINQNHHECFEMLFYLKRMTAAQKNHFVDLMAEMVMKKTIADMSAKEQKIEWSKITHELNKMGSHKAPEQWKRCWTDIKSTLKEKIAKNGKKKMTKTDLKVAAIINKERQDGNHELKDIGLRGATTLTSSRASVSSRQSIHSSVLRHFN